MPCFEKACLKDLHASVRQQLHHWLFHGDFDDNGGEYIHIPDDEFREKALRNIREAVLCATEEWELAMVITPYLLSEDIRRTRGSAASLIGDNRQRISQMH
ncbi:hypothetical protein HZA43_03800 [Candidatus Peregrinibacteria bacterium]|nr:hypothetical protein [Candidatus Peregrinibacteria bacterium]